MLSLREKNQQKIGISPRWPYRKVLVSEQALLKLEVAQAEITQKLEEVSLVLTRGFENAIATFFRKFLRLFGSVIFTFMYPDRSEESIEIFSPNGHDIDGNHVDVSIEVKGEILRLLPYGVFTSTDTLKFIELKHKEILHVVRMALENAGFKVHHNRTEALQIHCKLEARKR